MIGFISKRCSADSACFQSTASTSTARIIPVGILLPNPTVFALDDELGLLVLRQLSSALDGIGLTVMERVGT